MFQDSYICRDIMFIILHAVHEFNLHAIAACNKLYTCRLLVA